MLQTLVTSFNPSASSSGLIWWVLSSVTSLNFLTDSFSLSARLPDTGGQHHLGRPKAVISVQVSYCCSFCTIQQILHVLQRQHAEKRLARGSAILT